MQKIIVSSATLATLLGALTLSAGALAATPAAVDLLTNGSFQEGSDGWWLAGTEIKVKDGAGCMAITKPGANQWDVMLGQSMLGLRKGQEYTIAFTAYALEDTDLKANVQFDSPPYTSYFATGVNLTKTPQDFKFKFTMSKPDDPKAQFQFQLGARKATTVCVSKASLTGVTYAVKASLNSVRLNQLGYVPNAVKQATVATDATAPLAWTVKDQAGKVVAKGNTTPFGKNAASGENVQIADFSELTTPGDQYVLGVAGQSSHAFTISANIYGPLKRDAVAYFYHNRSGIAIDAAHVDDPKLARPAGHAPDKATCFNRRDEKGNNWSGCDYTLDVSKGWYDAGDHGKYVVNGGISLWTLQNMYERSLYIKGADSTWFGEGKLRIPDTAKGAPDLLKEARWEMDFLLAMQVPANKKLKLPLGDQLANLTSLKMTEVDAGGMVHQVIHDESWTGIPLRPDRDMKIRYLYFPTTAATLNMAATAAQSARIWKTLDPDYAARCLKAAETAWDAAVRQPQIYAYDQFTGGGPYNDNNVTDEFYWAAAELFVTTGIARYQTALRASPNFLLMPAGDMKGTHDLSWDDLNAAATITLAMVPNTLPPNDIKTARQHLMATANAYVAAGAKEGYGLPFAAEQYSWGSNGALANRGIILGLAYDFSGERKYLNAATAAMNYMLGRNPLDQSYVSGYGERPLKNPHHRFWAQQSSSDYPGPARGALSGGPNSVNFSDPVATALKGKCIGQTCWIDNNGAWTLNEITINWNAPFAWLVAFLDDAGRQ
ncbi:MAG: glycoside hydrolase family 9 protein [Pseudomonadota bacterium]